MMITNTVNTDLWIRERPQVIHAVQGDSCTRKITVKLFANRQPWEPETDVSVAIRFQRPDGSGGSYDTLPDGNKAWEMTGNAVSFLLAPQLLELPGRVSVQVELLGGKGILSSFPLELLVEENVAAFATKSGNYFSWEQRLVWELLRTLEQAKERGDFTGATPLLRIGTVSTVAASEAAGATLRGTPEEPILDLTLPKGADAAMDGTLSVAGQAADAAAVGAALAGKVPGGYGNNGETISHKGSVNSESELYAILDAEIATMPNASRKTISANIFFSDLGGGYFIIDIYKPFAGYAYADASTYDRCWLRFANRNNVWQPMEWVNPLLLPGVEYRTTERYNGKPVYVRAYHFGTAAVSNWWSWGEGVSGICAPASLQIKVGNTLLPAGDYDGGTRYANYIANWSGISLYMSEDFAGGECVAVYRYTKP